MAKNPTMREELADEFYGMVANAQMTDEASLEIADIILNSPKFKVTRRVKRVRRKKAAIPLLPCGNCGDSSCRFCDVGEA